jgi:hypothetical protein
MNYTHTLKKSCQSLKKGTKLTTFNHVGWKGEMVGIPNSKSDYWTPEFVAKHPEIFEKN